MDDRKRQGKSTENVGLVSKVEPLKPKSCGHCGKPGHIITNYETVITCRRVIIDTRK